MVTILTLRQQPYKGHNKHSSPLYYKELKYWVIGTIRHTQQHYNIGDKTFSLLESTPNHG